MVYHGNTPGCSDAMRLDRRTVLVALGSVGLAACQPIRVTEHTPGGTWRDGPALPLAVQEIYPALHDGRIHLAGGFVAENGAITGPTDRHFTFDPANNAWSSEPALPTPRHHPQLISFQGRLLALGGFESPSADRVWVMQSGGWVRVLDETSPNGGLQLDRTNEYWANLPELPRPSGEAVISVIENRLHLVGGREPSGTRNASWQDHIDTADHFVLNALDGDWERAAPLPTARNSAAGAMIGNEWHVVGGRTVGGGNTGTHDIYDAREDRWRSAAPLPQGQGGLAAASVDGRLYAFGGEFFSPEPGGVYAEAWCYVPVNDVWVQIDDMPSPRHGLGAIVMDRDIYVLGGALGVGGRDTSALVEIFTPI
ncbi:MAG: kelch repeat-containing protein [Pseudomonadota bacterium]